MPYFPLNDLPPITPATDPSTIKDLFLDGAVEVGKLRTEELTLADTMALSLAYGMLKALIDAHRLRDTGAQA